MDYKKYLNNRNLSKNTIQAYMYNYERWMKYLNERTASKTLIVKFIQDYQKLHKPRSVQQMYATIISVLRFEKKFKLINECSDIRLPSAQFSPKRTIKIDEFNKVKDTIDLSNWYSKRNWLIFSFLFYTGVRVSELTKINKKDIKDNVIEIRGKGNKTRVIYITDYLIELLDSWDHDKIAVKRDGKVINTKQINYIIKDMSIKYFGFELTPHGLRRSYATNLLRSNVNIEIVRRVLGHTSINTTSRYIQYNDDEVLNEIQGIFK